MLIPQTTPRCMKCRVIHDYNIEDEDLQVKAVANNFCQCAEDIVYVLPFRSDMKFDQNTVSSLILVDSKPVVILF